MSGTAGEKSRERSTKVWIVTVGWALLAFLQVADWFLGFSPPPALTSIILALLLVFGWSVQSRKVIQICSILVLVQILVGIVLLLWDVISGVFITREAFLFVPDLIFYNDYYYDYYNGWVVWMLWAFLPGGLAVFSLILLKQSHSNSGVSQGSSYPIGAGSMTTNEITPGWYPDPDGKPADRYWDGQSWTDQTRPRQGFSQQYGSSGDFSRETFPDGRLKPLSQAAVWSCIPLTWGWLGLILAFVGMCATGLNGNRRGRGAAVTGLVLNLLTLFVIVILIVVNVRSNASSGYYY